jgi:hypothetical protein
VSSSRSISIVVGAPMLFTVSLMYAFTPEPTPTVRTRVKLPIMTAMPASAVRSLLRLTLPVALRIRSVVLMGRRPSMRRESSW